MGSEILIYGYGLICLSMLVFNLIYNAYLISDAKRSQRRTNRVAVLVAPMIENVRDGFAVPGEHVKRLEQLLLRVNDLLAFDSYLQTLPAKNAGAYLERIAPMFTRLADVYIRREETQGAYFCHFIARWGKYFGLERAHIAPKIAGYVKHRSLYSRVNALKALCSLGESETLLNAFLSLGQDVGAGAPIHEKIVVETLLTFSGPPDELIDLIWRQFERFSVPEQRALLDYIRFQSGDYQDKVLSILLEKRRDKELHFSAIRYFGRYPDERARATLLRFVSDTDPTRWEYAAISASSLARYPGRDTIEALSGAMHSPNWYVRYNSASSLIQLGFTYDELLGAAAGSDRYAREMLTYLLETQSLQVKPKEEMVTV